MKHIDIVKQYLSVVLLLLPGILFGSLLYISRDTATLEMTSTFPYLPIQFWIIGVFGSIATVGGFLDWKFHRNALNMKISKKERNAEALALGIGGLPMFALMFFAMMSKNPTYFLIPILIVLIYTVVAISYDEFVFHTKRCGRLENSYHRMLVFGNGIAWLAWFHFIYC